MEYGFGLAVPKAVLGDPVAGAIWAALYEEAWTLFPNRVIPPAFAMKFKDGDGVDDQGKPFALREGYAQHLVFSCTTSLPIKFFRFENGQNILINEGIKCGDYVNVQLGVKAHAAVGQGKAGIYLNPNAVQLIGYGKEIINTPSGDQIFGTAMPPLPNGASSIPLAPQPGQLLVPPAPGGYAPPAGPPMMPPPNASTMSAPPAPYPSNQYQPPAPAAPAPHYGVVPPNFQPPPGGQPIAHPGYPQPAAPAPGGYPAPAGMPPYPGAPR